MTFRQRASARFRCQTVPGTPHCGKAEGEGRFRYVVEVTYSSRLALDGQGFLLDNLEFGRYFDSLGPLSESCEELAASACAHFRTLLEDRLQHVERICVRIFPFAGVCVEAESSPSAEVSP